jgi:hypothetical protein
MVIAAILPDAAHKNQTDAPVILPVSWSAEQHRLANYVR